MDRTKYINIVADEAYFVTSDFGWGMDADPMKALEIAKKSDLDGDFEIGYRFYRLPADRPKTFDIVSYEPKVDGAEYLFTIFGKAPAKKKRRR